MNLIINKHIIDSNLEIILLKLREESNGKYLNTIRKTGNNFAITCPFHKEGKESHPSCSVYCGDNQEIEYGWFKCFTCGEQGQLAKFIGGN